MKNTLTKFLLACTFAALLSAQDQVNYGTSLADGMAKERLRHAGVLMKINQERTDVAKQRSLALNDCPRPTAANREAIGKCHEAAEVESDKGMRGIRAKEINEAATYAKNVMALQNKWYDTRFCNRPDCVNNVQGQPSSCSGGNCK